jgi:hypothetical protein
LSPIGLEIASLNCAIIIRDPGPWGFFTNNLSEDYIEAQVDTLFELSAFRRLLLNDMQNSTLRQIGQVVASICGSLNRCGMSNHAMNHVENISIACDSVVRRARQEDSGVDSFPELSEQSNGELRLREHLESPGNIESCKTCGSNFIATLDRVADRFSLPYWGEDVPSGTEDLRDEAIVQLSQAILKALDGHN